MLSNRLRPRKMQDVFLILVLTLCFRPQILCNAQDVMERLKQCDVESVSFDVPNIVHFDISVLHESLTTGEIRSSRFLGRTIRLSEFQLRTEYLYEEFSPRVGVREKELYLQHSPEERVIASVGATEIPYDFFSNIYEKSSDKDSFQLRDVNPYVLLFSGTDAIGGKAGKAKPLQFILNNFVPLKGTDNHAVRSERAVVLKLEFDEKDPWKILRSTSLFPRGGPMERREYKDKVSSIEDCKDFSPLSISEAKWMDLPDGSHVPFWIYNRKENLNFSDPGRISEMEGFFFGIEIEPKIDENLFDPKRITQEEWNKDFNIEQIETLAKRERERILRRENNPRSSKK